MSNIFGKSYARGVADTVLRAGMAKVASLELAQEIADYVGSQIDFDPMAGKVPAEKTAAVACSFIDIAEKIASGTSTLITGGNAAQHNTPENAAAHNSLAALDLKNRGVNAYAKGESGVGQTDFKVPPGAQVGASQAHPGAPATTDHKENSVNKSASLHELIKKIASGTSTLVTGGDASQANTPENAAKDNSLAALDQKNRPEGTYAKGEDGVGKSDMTAAGNAAQTGTSQAHPQAPATTDSKSNSVNEGTGKSAAFIALFEETAKSYLPKLAHLADGEKVAAVTALMTLDGDDAAAYIAKLAK